MSAPFTVVATENAPKAIGPYSQAIKANGFVFCSGSIPVIPSTGELVKGDITAQTKQCFENMKAMVVAAGSAMEKVVKVNVYLSNMEEFATMNAEYAKWFTGSFPARCCVQVARLPKDVGIEIDCIALQ